MSSSGAVFAARLGRGAREDAASTDYPTILPPLPTGSAVLNTVFLHADVRGRPYRVEDFRDTLQRLEMLPEVTALGAYQMNHVWAVTFKSPEGKRKALAAGDLVVKGRRCLVIDPGNRDIRLKLHWMLYHVPDDEVKAALAPYGTVIEVGTEKWRVQGIAGCASMTRTAVIRLKPGLTLDDLPHQLRIAGGLALVVAPGRAPLCLRCQRTGHIRRDCRVPKCESCHRFGHDADQCVRTYAAAAGARSGETNAEHVMDETDAEEVAASAATAAKDNEERAKDGTDRLAPAELPKMTEATPVAVAETSFDQTTPCNAAPGKEEEEARVVEPTTSTEAQLSVDVDMADTGALATKRPRELDSDSDSDAVKVGYDSNPEELPGKTAWKTATTRRRKPRPAPICVSEPRGLDKPTG